MTAPASKKLLGKVVIITGGASGIGASAARLFAQNGAAVVIADIQDDLGLAVAAELGETASFIHCDVSVELDVANLVDTVLADHGKLDIMYSNAGIIEPRASRAAAANILSALKSDLDEILSVNLAGAFLCAKHAARAMVPARRGCILFTASACASVAGIAGHAYAASKHGVVGLARNLAAELGRHGIRVNCVSPFAVLTGIGGGGGLQFDAAATAAAEGFLGEIGNLKGSGVLTAEGVAEAALYLASDEAFYVSGLNLVVDGGFSVVNPSMMNRILPKNNEY